MKVTKQLKSVFVVYCLLLTIFVVMMIISPDYRSIENVGNILVQSVPLAVASLGQTIVMIGGGIDMSFGSTVSISTCLAAVLMRDSSLPIALLVVVLVLVLSTTIGFFNGVGVNKFKVPPIITTLAMMMIIDGVSLALLPGAGGKIHPVIAGFFTARKGLISVTLVILILCFVFIRQMLYNNKIGVSIYAIGENRTIANSMGIKVDRISIATYMICGLMAGVTGLLLASKMRIGDPVIGKAFGMDSITAAAIGGTSLSGGSGLVSGSIAGAFLIGMLSNMMNILGINHFYQYVLKGALLVVATMFYSISSSLEGGLPWGKILKKQDV